GQSLIAYLNAKSLTEKGLATADTYAHADEIYRAGVDISNTLTSKLKNDEGAHLSGAFSDMATGNSLRMLGVFNQRVQTTSLEPAVSYFDAGTASNIRIATNQGVNWDLFPTVNEGGQQYLKGYSLKNVSNGQEDKNFAFVPLGAKQLPHLISAPDF